jgi:hypothetical protein
LLACGPEALAYTGCHRDLLFPFQLRARIHKTTNLEPEEVLRLGLGAMPVSSGHYEWSDELAKLVLFKRSQTPSRKRKLRFRRVCERLQVALPVRNVPHASRQMIMNASDHDNDDMMPA